MRRKKDDYADLVDNLISNFLIYNKLDSRTIGGKR
nr:MAG TPA_asm: hypothetical protein [Caudoviricetes sp.]